MCLTVVPVYASDYVDAIVPVSCTAEGSTESFTVSIKGDSGFKASPETLNLKNGDTGNFKIAINLPGDYKYKIYQESGTKENTEYDKTVYQAEVFVTEDDNGKLNADTVVFTNGNNEKSANCGFVNKVKKETDKKDGSPGGGTGGDSSEGSYASQKSTSSGTERVKTGVETNEFMYVGIGLCGMIVATWAVKKRKERRG